MKNSETEQEPTKKYSAMNETIYDTILGIINDNLEVVKLEFQNEEKLGAKELIEILKKDSKPEEMDHDSYIELCKDNLNESLIGRLEIKAEELFNEGKKEEAKRSSEAAKSCGILFDLAFNPKEFESIKDLSKLLSNKTPENQELMLKEIKLLTRRTILEAAKDLDSLSKSKSIQDNLQRTQTVSTNLPLNNKAKDQQVIK